MANGMLAQGREDVLGGDAAQDEREIPAFKWANDDKS
jgi:hypothetical protein